jgi:hypothetical protein
MSDEPEPARPTLGSDQSGAREATEAAVRFVEELQAGLDEHDADAYNRHSAAGPKTHFIERDACRTLVRKAGSGDRHR